MSTRPPDHPDEPVATSERVLPVPVLDRQSSYVFRDNVAGGTSEADTARRPRVRSTADEIDASPVRARRDAERACGRCSRRRRRRRIYRRIAAALAALTVLQVGAVWSLRLIDPPFSRFMLSGDGPVVQADTDIEYVSRNLLVLVMGQEDQLFPGRPHAFDFDEVMDRAQDYMNGLPDQSGSTIPQQLAKNLWLTPDQTVVRKGVEAVLAEELVLLLPDDRILELYVNLAQFGPHVWGACAASWYWFGHSPRQLTIEESAQLVGLLPAPSHVRRGPDGGMVFDGEDNPVSSYTVAHALAHGREWFEAMGGYTPSGATATEAIGVEGFAEDFDPARDPCSSMPAAVEDLIVFEAGQ